MSTDIEPEYKEFEKAATYHRSFDIGGDVTPQDIMNFILDQKETGDDSYYVKYSWTDDNGVEQWRSTRLREPEDFDLWFEDYETDTTNYGIGEASGFAVVFVGGLGG